MNKGSKITEAGAQTVFPEDEEQMIPSEEVKEALLVIHWEGNGKHMF